MRLTASARKALLFVSLICLLFAVAVSVTGGFDFTLAGVRISAHRPFGAAAVGFAVVAFILLVAGPSAMRDDLRCLWRRPNAAASWLAAATALATLTVGLTRGSFAASGADAYGYVSQAELWAKGTLHIVQPLATTVPWPDPDWTFAPLGYRPATTPGSIVPTYPPGLPLLMGVALKVAGPSSVYFVVPLCGALAVWLTFVLGRRVDSTATGMVAAVLMATSPVFLFQLVQPMSDVPATAWWLAAAIAAGQPQVLSSFGAGVLTSLAILTRPNLAFLAPCLAALALFSLHESSLTHRCRTLGAFALGLVPGVAALALLHGWLYGSPLRSGYGNLDELWAVANVRPNAERYLRWLLETQTPLIGLALGAPFVPALRSRATLTTGTRRAGAVLKIWLLLAIPATLFASYLFYAPFEDWSYIRFLLPGLPFLLVLASTVALTLVRRLPLATRGIVVIVGCVFIASWYVHIADERGAFSLQASDSRYRESGEYAAAFLPTNAVVFAAQESGSVRHYSGRVTVRWDLLDPRWLDRAVAHLREQGYSPYFLVEAWEEPVFRGRFAGGNQLGSLDWPPTAEIGRIVPVRIYDPADRVRFLSGEPLRPRRVF